jgi:hypothetical protein
MGKKKYAAPHLDAPSNQQIIWVYGFFPAEPILVRLKGSLDEEG